MTKVTSKIDTIKSKYFIISDEVKSLIETLNRSDDFEITYLIDKFLSNRPLLTISEKNFLLEVKNCFKVVLVNK
jgi:hypothetical protein